MLSKAIQEEIAHAVREFGGNGRAAGIDALLIAQRHEGWVSDETLREVAGLLGQSVDELDSVATFFNLIYRRPVGRHVIHVCNSVCCWSAGYEGIQARLESLLGVKAGETTADGRFTLLPIVCLGVCDEAPAMMVDGRTHGRLTVEGLESILAEYE